MFDDLIQGELSTLRSLAPSSMEPLPRWGCLSFFLILFLSLVTLLVNIFFGNNIVFFLCQMGILVSTVCIVPSIVVILFSDMENYGTRMVVEISAFVSIFLAFDLWFFWPNVWSIWVVYAIALVFLIVGGGYFIKWRKSKTINRITHHLQQGENWAKSKAKIDRPAQLPETISESISSTSSGSELSSEFDSELDYDSNNTGWSSFDPYLFKYSDDIYYLLHQELLFYISVPVGLVAATIWGAVHGFSPKETLHLGFIIILFMAALILLYFLLCGFQRMCDPGFVTSDVEEPVVSTDKRAGFLFRILEIFVPPVPTQEAQRPSDIDLACDASELRKIYKYDMLHNSLLFVSFTAILVSLWGIVIDVRWLIGIFLGAALVFSEVPYGIGQYRLHTRVLERYQGRKFAEIKKDLEDYAPIFPPIPFLAVLMAGGTIGGFLFLMLNFFIQGAFK